MNLNSNTVLITGGSNGIGLALATRFQKAGSKVIICGRNLEKLEAVKKANPGLEIYVCDVSKEAERISLFENITQAYPSLNILVNNAGIMRFLQLDTPEPWSTMTSEIETNLEAPIHLTMLFAKHLEKQSHSAIINVTSALSHVPLAVAPIYSATKAGLHSLTLSLRHQFSGKSIQIIEIAPPHVETDLGVAGSNTAGMNLDEFADATILDLEKGEQESTVGFAKTIAYSSRAEKDTIFKQINAVPAH